jgi:hypothetical protein
VRAFLFYPLLAIAAAALIVASFGYSLRPILPAPQAARVSGAAMVYGPAALAAIAPGADQLLYADRTMTGAARSIHLGTLRTSGAPDAARQGARLLLTPADAAALAGAPLIVTVTYRPIAANIAPQLSLSAQGDGPVAWVTKAVPVTEGRSRFDLPASAGPLSAIGLWPHPQADEYYSNYGIEIVSLRVQRATPPA